MKLLQQITELQGDARLRELLKWLSHELRTPLTALSAASQVLECVEPGSADAVEAREVIARQVQQLTQVVEQLRTLYPEDLQGMDHRQTGRD